MSSPTLRLGDGFKGVSLSKREHVIRLQKALNQLGFTVDDDGLFGQGTFDAVTKLQKQHNLTADGIVGPATWRVLSPNSSTAHFDENIAQHLDGFRGDLHWIHNWEGHAGKPYWPGGASGVTLDPGFDLAHQNEGLLKEYYGCLGDNVVNRLCLALGKAGDETKSFVKNEDLSDIRVSRDLAYHVMPLIANKYWQPICKRFPVLSQDDTPACVQTVLLSLAYNRGTYNKGLEPLAQPLQDKHWLQVADIIANMQQDHKLKGIRRRRTAEANYIRDELDFSTNGHGAISTHDLMALLSSH